MQIRVHSVSDFEQLAELRWLLKAEDSIDKPLGKTEFCRDYCKQLRSSETLGDTINFVIEDAQTLAAALTIRIVRKELSPGRAVGAWGYLTNVIVREKCRDRGLGTRLLKYAVRWSVEKRL